MSAIKLSEMDITALVTGVMQDKANRLAYMHELRLRDAALRERVVRLEGKLTEAVRLVVEAQDYGVRPGLSLSWYEEAERFIKSADALKKALIQAR